MYIYIIEIKYFFRKVLSLGRFLTLAKTSVTFCVLWPCDAKYPGLCNVLHGGTWPQIVSEQRVSVSVQNLRVPE